MTQDLLRLKVHPGSRENRLEIRGPAAYEAWVRAEAAQGKANAAVLSLLAQKLGLPPKNLRIIKGSAAPSKIIAVFKSRT